MHEVFVLGAKGGGPAIDKCGGWMEVDGVIATVTGELCPHRFRLPAAGLIESYSLSGCALTLAGVRVTSRYFAPQK